MEWIDVTNRLPDFDKKVLVYYEIKSSKNDEVFKYIDIASIESIQTFANNKFVNWVNDEHDSVRPTHWMLLPNYPNIN